MLCLFAGGYGVLRNPAGHRKVDFDDVSEAAEAVVYGQSPHADPRPSGGPVVGLTLRSAEALAWRERTTGAEAVSMVGPDIRAMMTSPTLILRPLARVCSGAT